MANGKKPHYFFYCSFAVLWLMHKSKFLQNGKIPLTMKKAIMSPWKKTNMFL